MFDPIFFKDLEDAIALEDSHLLAVEQENSGGIRKQKKLTFGVLKSWILAIADIAANIAYRNRTKTKVLWTGPLSVVGVPTSLNAGEKFSDWDLILWGFSLISDVDLSIKDVVPFPNQLGASMKISTSNSSGIIIAQQIDDDTFSLLSKSVAGGNLSFIFGVKL